MLFDRKAIFWLACEVGEGVKLVPRFHSTTSSESHPKRTHNGQKVPKTRSGKTRHSCMAAVRMNLDEFMGMRCELPCREKHFEFLGDSFW